jgi:hypothetical protein
MWSLEPDVVKSSGPPGEIYAKQRKERAATLLCIDLLLLWLEAVT